MSGHYVYDVVHICGFEADAATAADLARELCCSTDDLVTKSGDPIDGDMNLLDLDAEATAKKVGCLVEYPVAEPIRFIRQTERGPLRRERYGKFGIASANGISTEGWYAWGRYGDTTADTVMGEPTEPVWFAWGETREAAIAELKAELDTVDAQQFSVLRLNGVQTVLYGVATDGAEGGKDDVFVYADADTGQLFYRTLEDFATSMLWDGADA